MIFRVETLDTINMVFESGNVNNLMSWLELETFEMKPVVSRKFIVIEVYPKSQFVFTDVLLALATRTSSRFCILNLKVLPQIAYVLSHQTV